MVIKKSAETIHNILSNTYVLISGGAGVAVFLIGIMAFPSNKGIELRKDFNVIAGGQKEIVKQLKKIGETQDSLIEKVKDINVKIDSSWERHEARDREEILKQKVRCLEAGNVGC